MKIIYFSPGYSTHDHRFLKAISDGGHEVYFVQLEGNLRQVESRAVPEHVNQVIWKGGREPFTWSKLPALAMDFKRLHRDLEPDLVHAGPIQTCGLIATLSGFHPILAMSWGFDLMDDVHKNKWWEWVTRYVLRRTDFFTSDANITRDKAVVYGMNPEKTVVIPWGVDLEHFRRRKAEGGKRKAEDGRRKTEDGRRKTEDGRRKAEGGRRKTEDGRRKAEGGRQRAEGFVLFCNRAWEPRYGVDVLARAFVKVARQRDDVRLILLGGGSQGVGIRKILQGGGVEEYVTFGGQISQTDLPRWYHMADLYISPSHVDGSSVSLMEALACGLPCLVSDIPGNKEWIIENENGWLFRDGDADHLAEKILAAMNQREKLPGVGESARRSAENRADWKKNAEALMKVYRSLGEKDAN